MSFGFSVSDIMNGATLAFQLYKAMSSTKGSKKEYQDLIAELDVVHKVLLQVEQLRAANQLAQATLNAVLFIVNAANEAMESFLISYDGYGESLKAGGSGNPLKDCYRKGKWAFQMPAQVGRYLATRWPLCDGSRARFPLLGFCSSFAKPEGSAIQLSDTMFIKVEKLRGTLTTMLVSINCLVQLGCFYGCVHIPEFRAHADLQPSAGYHPGRKADLHEINMEKKNQSGFADVSLEASIWPRSWRFSSPFKISPDLLPVFQTRRDAPRFFRPGQVFSIRIQTNLSLLKMSRTSVDRSQLPLEPISDATVRAAEACLSGPDLGFTAGPNGSIRQGTQRRPREGDVHPVSTG